MITEQQARDFIQKSSIFHNHWSSKCQTWFEMWNDLKELKPISLLNVGVGPEGGNSTVRWLEFWKKMFPSIHIIEHLELNEENAKKSQVTEKIHLGDVRDTHKIFPPNSWDIIFWCQGPEHIHRNDWKETFENLSKVAEIIVMQCPWGSGYDYDQYHFSKSIRRGEFEKFGFKTLYNGKENTTDAGIIAYKVGR